MINEYEYLLYLKNTNPELLFYFASFGNQTNFGFESFQSIQTMNQLAYLKKDYNTLSNWHFYNLPISHYKGNMPDAFIGNSLTMDYITIQYKSRYNRFLDNDQIVYLQKRYITTDYISIYIDNEIKSEMQQKILDNNTIEFNNFQLTKNNHVNEKEMKFLKESLQTYNDNYKKKIYIKEHIMPKIFQSTYTTNNMSAESTWLLNKLLIKK